MAEAAPQKLWSHDFGRAMPLYCKVNQQNDDYLFVCLKNGGFAVMKSAGKAGRGKVQATLSKKQLGGLDCINLTQKGSIVYLALGNFFSRSSKMGIAAVDVKNPNQPKVVRPVGFA